MTANADSSCFSSTKKKTVYQFVFSMNKKGNELKQNEIFRTINLM
jgi:hypothetical protein